MRSLLKKAEGIESRYGKLLLYFTMIPFLYPRGFAECWPWYKTLFTLWLYAGLGVAAVWIVYDVLSRGLHYKKAAYWIVGYHILFVAITLLTQKGIHEGLQKMLASPVLCVFAMLQLRLDGKRFLRAVVDLLILNFLLNVSAFCVPVTDKMIDMYHVNFLGHVHVSAQLGLLGLFAGCLLYRLDPGQKERIIVLMVLSVLTMLWSDTAASMLALAVMIGCLVLWLCKPVRPLLLMDSRLYLWASIALSIALLLYSLTGIDTKLGINALAINGRTFVWRDGLARFFRQPFFGYGAYGTMIVTFWSEGMNYAHNELLQRLLDGGIVLAVAFYAMLTVCFQAVGKTRNKGMIALTNTFLISALLVMQFESVTEYYYMYLLFVLAASIPEIYRAHRKEERR